MKESEKRPAMVDLIEKKDWKARWIRAFSSVGPDSWTIFEKEFLLECEPCSAIAFIAVDSRYFLCINGMATVRDGGLNRGPWPGAGYYDSVDIKGYLKEGLNKISILAWYWGNQGRNSLDSGMGGLLFQAEIDGLVVAGDSTWAAGRHPAFQKTGGPLPSYLYAGHNIGYDAGKCPVGMFAVPPESFANAVEMGACPCGPWGELFQRPVPQWKDYGLKDYPDIETKKTPEGTVVIARLPYAAQISPYFMVDSPGGLKLDVCTDRYMVRGGNGDENNVYRGHRLEYMTCGGPQEFEFPGWLFGESVIYEFPPELSVMKLMYRETGYDCGFEGDFKCGDPLLNRLAEKAARTLYTCMRDNFMDCPDRERGQWIGDVSSQVPQAFYILGRSSDMLAKKAIRDFIMWKSGDILRGNVPGAHCAELPSQSLNAVGMEGMIMSYYMHSGDMGVIEMSYDAVRAYLLMWEIDADGAVVNREGSWDWYDHGKNIDKPVILHAWYYSAVMAARSMAGILGRVNDMEFFLALEKRLKESFRKLYWTGSCCSSGSICDDRANGMALLTGLAREDEHERILSVLRNVRNATPYMEGYIVEGMFRAGYGREAISRIRDRYGPLVMNRDSTLWEDFEILGTRNHAWSGGAAAALYRYVAGIFPLEPGYRRIGVKPDPCGLEYARATVPSARGPVSVSFEAGKGSFDANVSIPKGCRAEIWIPMETGDGKLFKFSAKGRRLSIEAAAVPGEPVHFETGPGNLSIRAEYY
ncbi:MAG: hypothetical protein JXB33_02770 [Clostridia bacterium]|nr:hypothetical protein [Clostridia bacterium]